MRLGLLLVVALAGGCASRSPDHLYHELGGKRGIETIVDAFLVELAGDERIVHHFKTTNVGDFRRLLIEQFCELAGGPCTYSGDTMAMSHRGMGIRYADFDALVEDLIVAMENVDVPVRAQNRLLALLAPMHGEIMGVQDIEPL